MKILMFTTFEYPHIGGMSTHMTLIKRGLLDNGNEVEVLSTSNINRILRKIIFSLPCKILSLFNKDIGTFWFNFINEIFLTTLLLIKLFNGKKFDIINCQDVLACRIVCRIQKFFRYKIIFTVHGYFVMQSISNGVLSSNSCISRMYSRIEREVYSSVDYIITVDNRIKNYIIDCAGIRNSEKITVLKNFIDINYFKHISTDKEILRKKWNLPQNKFIILCPRRLVPKNGVIYPILAMAQIKSYDQIILVYAGDGQEKSKMEELIRENELNDRVFMLGDIDHQSIVELYNLCDLVIVPSVNSAGVEEATSISAIEGMACSKVVIASNIGGLKELITHDYNGILVREKDINELSNNILSIYLDNEKRKFLENNARKTVEEQFSLNERIKDYLRIFRKALN